MNDPYEEAHRAHLKNIRRLQRADLWVRVALAAALVLPLFTALGILIWRSW
jgi:hypothetical protein